MENNELKSTQAESLPAVVNFFDKEVFNTMQRVSQCFASSDLVPDMYRITENNPREKAMANCMIALDMSNRIGANILMVMQNLNIIYGRPSWSSKFLISTVNTCGRFEPLRYRFNNVGKVGKIKITEYEAIWETGSNGKKYKKNIAKEVVFDGSNIDNIECVAYTTQKGKKEVLESIPVSIKMAIEEGWYNKAGSKWKTMPQLMLTYRSASYWVNSYAPELSMGMRTTEEIQDVDYEEVVVDSVSNEISQNANKQVMDFDKEVEAPTHKEDVHTEVKDEEKVEADVVPVEPTDEIPLFLR